MSPWITNRRLKLFFVLLAFICTNFANTAGAAAAAAASASSPSDSEELRSLMYPYGGTWRAGFGAPHDAIHEDLCFQAMKCFAEAKEALDPTGVLPVDKDTNVACFRLVEEGEDLLPTNNIIFMCGKAYAFTPSNTIEKKVPDDVDTARYIGSWPYDGEKERIRQERQARRFTHLFDSEQSVLRCVNSFLETYRSDNLLTFYLHTRFDMCQHCIRAMHGYLKQWKIKRINLIALVSSRQEYKDDIGTYYTMRLFGCDDRVGEVFDLIRFDNSLADAGIVFQAAIPALTQAKIAANLSLEMYPRRVDYWKREIEKNKRRISALGAVDIRGIAVEREALALAAETRAAAADARASATEPRIRAADERAAAVIKVDAVNKAKGAARGVAAAEKKVAEAERAEGAAERAIAEEARTLIPKLAEEITQAERKIAEILQLVAMTESLYGGRASAAGAPA